MTDSTAPTFANIPAQFADPEQAAIWLQSIPYDGTSTWGKGADQGFHAFLDAAEHMELYDIETDSEVYKKGIYMPAPITESSSPEQMVQTVHQETAKLLEHNKFLTFFGGEHSISIGILRAYMQAFKNLTVLQIDAHTDLRPSFEGSACNHACAVYEASKQANLVQVGIRSMDASEKEHLNAEKCFFAHEMAGHDKWMQRSIDQLSDPVYITFDLDALDPSIMPATGTPEPGGLQWNTTMRYLKQVFAQKNVVGFDIVELAPIDGLKAPNFLAAKLYYKMLSYKFAHNG